MNIHNSKTKRRIASIIVIVVLVAMVATTILSYIL